MLISPGHCRAAYEGAFASMDEGQRTAVRQLVDATCMSSFQPGTVQRRLDAAFKREADDMNRLLAKMGD